MFKKCILIMAALLGALTIDAKTVSVSVTPENAKVYQNGNILSPVSNGLYQITISNNNISLAILAEGYDSERLVVNSKSPKKIDIDLKPNRKHIIVSTEPNYAAIYINGRETAKGKADFYIFKNEKKTIKVVADGYETYSKQFDFKDFNLQQDSVHITMEGNIH